MLDLTQLDPRPLVGATLVLLIGVGAGLALGLPGRRVWYPPRRRAQPWPTAVVLWLLAASFFAPPLAFLGAVAMLALPDQWHTLRWRPGQQPWADALRAGYLGWLVLTVPVLLLNLAVQALLRAQGSEPIVNPLLERLLRDDVTFAEFAAASLIAVGLAPVMEEVLFRGILQPWLVSQDRGALVGGGLAVLLVGIRQVVVPTTPFAGVLFTALVAGGLSVLELVPRGAALARVATAGLLFAVAHPSWPDPVALWLLGTGLGWVYHRTRSLLAPMVVHALFNATSLLLIAGRVQL